MRGVYTLIPLVGSVAFVHGLAMDTRPRATSSKGSAKAKATGSPSPNELYPLPQGFKIEPDLDTSKKPSTPRAKIVKIRQGPFKLAPGKQVDTMQQWIPEPEIPCRDCYITAIQGGLEFKDGKAAHADDGAMLQVRTIAGCCSYLY